MYSIVSILLVLVPAAAEDLPSSTPPAQRVPVVAVAYPGFNASANDFTVLVVGVYRDGAWRELSVPTFVVPDSATIQLLSSITEAPLCNAGNKEEVFVPHTVGMAHIIASPHVSLNGEFPGPRPAGSDEFSRPQYLMTTNLAPIPLRHLAAGEVAGLQTLVVSVTDKHALAFDPGYDAPEKFSETLEGLSPHEILVQWSMKSANDPEIDNIFDSDAFAEMLSPLGLTPAEASDYLTEQLLTPGQPVKESERERVDEILRIMGLAVDIVEARRNESLPQYLPNVLQDPVFRDVIPFEMPEGEKALWISAMRAYPPELDPSTDPLDERMWCAYYSGIVQQLPDGELKPLWEESGVYGGNSSGPVIDLIGICDVEGDGNPEVVIEKGGNEWGAYELLTCIDGKYTVAASAGGAL